MNKRLIKAVGSAVTAALVLTTVTPVYASTQPAQRIEVKAAYNEQLDYANQEIAIAVDYLYNKDLTDRDNHNAMLIFASTASERVRNLGSEYEAYVQYIYNTAQNVSKGAQVAGELILAVEEVESVFAAGESVETKKEALAKLNAALSYAHHQAELNEVSKNSANKKLHDYVQKLTEEMNPSIPVTPIEPSTPVIPVTPIEPSTPVQPEGPSQEDKDRQELEYAIEEMRIVVDYLDNKNLADEEAYNYALTFAQTAVERVRNMPNEGHVSWIFETAEEARVKFDTASRLIQAMRNVETVFDADRNDTIENKKVVLEQLNAALSDAIYSYYANSATANYVNEFLHEYVAILEEEIKNEEATGETNPEQDQEQLGYAIEEMRIVVDYIDNQDLTNRDNIERMLIFAQTAVERVRNMPNEGHVEWIHEVAGEVNAVFPVAQNLILSIEELQGVFADGEATLAEQKVAIDKLNAVLSDAVWGNKINETTLYSANDTLHGFANQYLEAIQR